MNPENYLYLAALLFTIGAAGVLLRRNAIVVFMCTMWRSVLCPRQGRRRFEVGWYHGRSCCLRSHSSYSCCDTTLKNPRMR